MQDNDFDKIFSHKFGQLSGEPYDEENWSELSQRMDMHNRRRTRWVLPAMFFLLGALTGSNVFWWYQWREADKRLQNRESRITFYQSDTMSRRTVIYHYDTIYQNVTVVRRQEAGAPMKFSTNAPSNSFSTNNLSADNSSVNTNPLARNPAFIESPAVPNVQDSAKQQFTNGDAAAPGNTIVHKTPMDTSELATPPLSSGNAATTDTLFENLLKSQPPPTKKVQTGLIYFARPRVGITAVLGFPSFPHKISGSIWGAGIRSDVEFARNFRLGAEVAYQQANLKADETEVLEELDIDIPDPGGDYRLKYWETYFLPAFTYSMHLRYEIPLRSNWTPWFGIGGQAITILPFEIEYEFENEFNNLELHIPAKAGSSTNWQGMMFMLGVECRLNPHLYFGAEGFMIRHFGENEDEHDGEGRSIIGNQLGLKTSIIYKF